MRIAVLGNSHSACVRLAQIRDGYEHDLRFFAAPADKMKNFLYSNGRFIAQPGAVNHILRTSGGTELLVTDFDAYFIVGLGFSVPQISRNWSKALRTNLLTETIRSSQSWRFASLLSQECDATIFVAHQPLAALGADGCPPHPDRHLLSADALTYDDVFDECRNIFKLERVKLIRQPPETIAYPFNTRHFYSVGSATQAGKVHSDDERYHMNPEYGVALLRSLSRAIENESHSAAGRTGKREPETDSR